MNMKINTLGIVPVFLLISLFMYGCKSDAGQTDNQVKFVKVYSIESGARKSRIVFNGKIQEKSKIDLSFRVGGPLVKLPLNVGDFVKKGSLIAEIDNRDYRVQFESSEARYKQIQSEFERYKELFDKKKIPANTYEKIEAQYLLTKSGYENALHQLNDTRLTAPISGYVYKKFVENYQTVGPGQSIVSIIDKSSLEVVTYVPENQLSRIISGKEFYLNVSSTDIDKAPVTIENIAEKAGDNGLYEVRFKLANDNDNVQVYPGMTAEISMYYSQPGGGITIPSGAVFRDGGETCVWIYSSSDSTVKKQKVTISSLQSDGLFTVSEGLKAGDSIISAGVHYLQEGQRVQPVKEPSKTNVGGLL